MTFAPRTCNPSFPLSPLFTVLKNTCDYLLRVFILEKFATLKNRQTLEKADSSF